jgi:hypothetical protein
MNGWNMLEEKTTARQEAEARIVPEPEENDIEGSIFSAMAEERSTKMSTSEADAAVPGSGTSTSTGDSPGSSSDDED